MGKKRTSSPSTRITKKKKISKKGKKADNKAEVDKKPISVDASGILRHTSEDKYQKELEYLQSVDNHDKPVNWKLSPQILKLFILGSKKKGVINMEIEKKFYGDEKIVERSIVTLASDRGLLLIGKPGTGKSWLAELLAAGISGNSKLVVQGTAATTEDQIKYSWNIAQVIANGQSPETIIPSPIMKAMEEGSIGRFEELTRCTSDVQDALISIMSEKYISIPELDKENLVFAKRGFNVVATANSKDKGVNELSSALKRRFNFVTIPIITNAVTEKEIISFRLSDLMGSKGFETEVPSSIIDMLIKTFEDIRRVNEAATMEVDKLESSLSTAEQISILEDTILQNNFFSSSSLPQALAQSIVGSLTRRVPEDLIVMNKIWNSVISKYTGTEWVDFIKEGQDTMKKFKV